jgi:hypothetical protein
MKRFAILARERYTADGMAANLKDFTLREEGETDPAQLLSAPELTLYCLDLECKRAAFVSTPPEINLEDAPFYHDWQFNHARELFTVEFDTFLGVSAQIPQADTLVLIHNIGRCGSTLLSKAFSPIDSCTSYSEPDSFTQMAFWRTIDDPRDGLWRLLLPARMKFTFRDAHSQRPSRAIIKFHSACLNLLDLFLDCFPDARHLFLYRHCSSWVASLISLVGRHQPIPSRTHEEAMKNWRHYNGRCVDQSTFPFHRLPETITGAQAFAVSWLVYLELVTKILQSYPGRLFLVRYDELTTNREACLQKIFTHCGLPQDRLADSLKAFDTDSQAGTTFARVDADAGAKRQLPESDRSQMQAILNLHPYINDSGYTIAA